MNRFVLSVSRCLVSASLAACWATVSLAQQGQQGESVTVVNTPSVRVVNTPLPVVGTVAIVNPPNTASPAVNATIVNLADLAKALQVGQPVHQTLSINDEGSGTPYTVPSNKRLVIEYISGACSAINSSLPVLSLTTGPIPTFPSYPLLTIPVPAGPSFEADPVFNHMVRIYVDAGSTLNLDHGQKVGGGGTQHPSVDCGVVISGQLFDTP